MTDRLYKFYIMSCAASGKSTFTSKYSTYAGCRIVDIFDLIEQPKGVVKLILYLSRLIPKLRLLAANSKSQLAKRPKYYFPTIRRYLETQTDSVLVLGNRGPDDPASLGQDILLASVIIPEADHRRNCESRREGMRNPLPFMHHQTTDFANVLRMRENLANYSARHNIPVFESFEEAIDALIVSSGGVAHADMGSVSASDTKTGQCAQSSSRVTRCNFISRSGSSRK